MAKIEFILIDEVPQTLNIENKHKRGNNYYITFHNDEREHSYPTNRVLVIKKHEWFSPRTTKVLHKDEVLNDVVDIWRFTHEDREYWRIKFRDREVEYSNSDEIRIETSNVGEDKATSIIAYLNDVAAINPIGIEKGENSILLELYQKLDHIDENSVAAIYLNPKTYKHQSLSHELLIYPFASNKNQKQAVEKAFENQISVIQGPPGTGKTQTILNIIANIVRNNQTVMVVSNSNYAIDNVYNKLDAQGLSFIVARLGKRENKEAFINEQPTIQQELEEWGIERESETECELKTTLEQLDEIYQLNIDKAKFCKEQEELEHEWKYFCMRNNISEDTPLQLVMNSSEIVDNWFNTQTRAEKIVKRYDKPLTWVINLVMKIWFCWAIRHKMKLKSKYDINNLNPLIVEFQILYYLNRRKEVKEEIEKREQELAEKNAGNLINKAQNISMTLLKAALHKRYKDMELRAFLDVEDMHRRNADLMRRYPIILSTAFCARFCLFSRLYDYVIIDESSQVSIDMGTLALTCGKNAVIVGDSNQLPNIVNKINKAKLSSIMSQYSIPEQYDCEKNNLLESFCSVLKDVPTSDLKEHYRSHPRIINFCNQKFYKGELVIMTEDRGEENVLQAFRTSPRNGTTRRKNQREIDEIRQTVLPIVENMGDISVVTPYKDQVTQISSLIPNIEVSTVDKIQGREKDVVILSTVDKEISHFVDNPNRLNVAVSRAKKKFCLVTTDNETKKGHVKDLLDYIEYNNCSISYSNITSIFDCLYKQYTDKYIADVAPKIKISEYKSENATYEAIAKVIKSEKRLVCLSIVCHFPLLQIIKDTSLIESERERRYAINYHTHVDFLVINKASKKPVLAIETDGSYHRTSKKQQERDKIKNHILELYNVPLLRLPTDGCNEEELIRKKLLELVGQ